MMPINYLLDDCANEHEALQCNTAYQITYPVLFRRLKIRSYLIAK